MLTSSSNQYLRPEYLTPLPTTLDSKKSPLALLAATCSSIGADPPNAKPLWPSLSSSSSSSSCSGRDSGTGTGAGSTSTSERSTSSTSSSSGTGNNGKKSKTSTSQSGFKNEKGKSKSSSGGTSSSPNSSKTLSIVTENTSSDKEREKNITTIETKIPLSSSSSSSSISDENRPSSRASGSRSKTPASVKENLTETPPGNVTLPSPISSEKVASRGDTKSPALLNTSREVEVPSNTKSHEPSSNTSTSSSSSSAVPLSSSLSSHPFSASLSATASSSLKLNQNGPLDHSPLASVAKQNSLSHFPLLYPGVPPPFPAALNSGVTGIPPYLHSYARLKAASHSFDPLGSCRDPFCSGCQLGGGSGHLLASAAASHHYHAAGKCLPGCLQCDHKTPGLPTPGMMPSFFPGIASLPHSLASLYSAHAAVAAAAAANHSASSSSAISTSTSSTASLASNPYVCNWIQGENYCGKRFSSADELLTHLRTHTSTSAAALSSSVPPLDPIAALLDARYGPVAPTQHPLLSAAFSRSYPTPPLSPLSSARYHPYTKPNPASSLLGSTSAGVPGAPHPLSPYYPYSFYGQR